MKIVFLDIKTLSFPVEVSGLQQFGQVDLYDDLADEDVSAVIEDADILITNQNQLNESNLNGAKALKLICQAGTGYNNIDVEYCRKKGIAVANVPAYAAKSVAQHTFSMLFYLISHSGYYDYDTKHGNYSKGVISFHSGKEFFELEGKTWGIIGFGEIGRKVAQYAQGFGCEIIYFSTSGINQQSSFQRVTLEELLKRSDILSIHAPLNDRTRNLIGLQELKLMKNTAYLLNLGRGGIVREEDIATALSEEIIAGAGLDVFEEEPLSQNNPLLRIDGDNLYMTPHIGYASKEARMRLMETICSNIDSFLKHEERNRIV
ncbi:MAG: NAD(P)-dependent oxidoreductase [Bacillota bacterium]